MNRMVYLDNASTPLYNEKVLACATEYADIYRDRTIETADCLRCLNGFMTEARSRAASLINCAPSNIALVQCTSHGLDIAANAIPLHRGDNILISDLEFLAAAVCWYPRIKNIGAELRMVRNSGGRILAEDFEAQLDSHTKAIVVSAVQEITGYRADIKKISEMAHSHGCLLIVDGIQEVGAFKVDVKDTGVDFYCAGGKKWIGNPFGTGFLYVRSDISKLMEPVSYGYYNIKLPDRYNNDFVTYLEDPNRTPLDICGFREDAMKYEIGAYGNFLGAMGFVKATEVIEELGADSIEARIRALGDRLIAGIEECGLELCRPHSAKENSAIFPFNLGFNSGTSAEEHRLMDFLRARNIHVSLRCSTGTGGIRPSVHYYNTEEDIDLFINGIRDFLKKVPA